MKKILTFLAMTASILMVSVAVSCNKNDDDDDDEGGSSEYVAPIKIDGDFSDWAKLDGSKIASASTNKDATKTALKTVKVYADAIYVFVYFEWDKDQISHEPDVEHVPSTATSTRTVTPRPAVSAMNSPMLARISCSKASFILMALP